MQQHLLEFILKPYFKVSACSFTLHLAHSVICGSARAVMSSLINQSQYVVLLLCRYLLRITLLCSVMLPRLSSGEAAEGALSAAPARCSEDCSTAPWWGTH